MELQNEHIKDSVPTLFCFIHPKRVVSTRSPTALTTTTHFCYFGIVYHFHFNNVYYNIYYIQYKMNVQMIFDSGRVLFFKYILAQFPIVIFNLIPKKKHPADPALLLVYYQSLLWHLVTHFKLFFIWLSQDYRSTIRLDLLFVINIRVLVSSNYNIVFT